MDVSQDSLTDPTTTGQNLVENRIFTKFQGVPLRLIINVKGGKVPLQ